MHKRLNNSTALMRTHTQRACLQPLLPYTAPELVGGLGSLQAAAGPSITPGADVFSTALVLYELFTGGPWQCMRAALGFARKLGHPSAAPSSAYCPRAAVLQSGGGLEGSSAVAV